jgi:hypothetical protein
MSRIGLVSGSSSQLKIRALAERSYTSAWFQKARVYAINKCDRWYILSPHYGLIEPDQLIDPYTDKFRDFSREDQFKWAQRVLVELGRTRLTTMDTIVILASTAYRDLLAPMFEARNFRYEAPLVGMGITNQMKWLRDEVED